MIGAVPFNNVPFSSLSVHSGHVFHLAIAGIIVRIGYIREVFFNFSSDTAA
ncbi:MAG TPA: hypothetical protein DEB17_01800 [Chlorobaculum sp.]|uniref:Uncharacterized protein n=1 Tax=Chlorobaculum tepidum (strain ATCC 49652 / DSM 12025 / NBRC 103806 / TLS) TaxID=194439 RepID=Q8KDH1_CHLTE|nr:hypothetical protein CT1079 [Chlorobaculum tepidum TLS]HBU22733.1 hypothetical protein [Chlorobaculum sp.]